jgi:hypothetical protein
MSPTATQDSHDIRIPFGLIWNRLREGKVIPFLGAGASFVGRGANETWSDRDPRFLPSGAELSRALADDVEFPLTDPEDREDLAKVASYYEGIGGRDALRARLRQLLGRPYAAGSVHQFLAAVPVPLLIVVTNYDTLLERAFLEAGRPFDLVAYPADDKSNGNALLWWAHGKTEPELVEANRLDIDLESTSVIFKMHGTLGRGPADDHFVVSEEDYTEFLSRLTNYSAVPALFFRHFLKRNFLFLGYSLRDWNLRVVLSLRQHFSAERGGVRVDEALRSWAIQYNPSALERELWANRGVRIFDCEIGEFVARLKRVAEV